MTYWPTIEMLVAMGPRWLDESIASESADCDGRIKRQFRIHEFQDGDDIGLPKWAQHIVIGGYREQGWSAFDQRQHGKSVAGDDWGEPLLLLSDGRLTSHRRRGFLKLLRDARAASVGRNPKGENTEECLSAEHEHAVTPKAADAQRRTSAGEQS